MKTKAEDQKQKRAGMTESELTEPMSPAVVIDMPEEEASIKNVEE